MPITRFVSMLCLAIVAFLIGTATAEEWPHGAAHIICDPEHGYFGLRTLEVFDPNEENYRAGNIYFPQSLAAQPFECALAKHRIEAHGVDDVVKGPCGYRAGAKLRVSINGVPVAHKFEATSTMSSTKDLSNGWIAASSCFEWEHRVEIRTGPTAGEWMNVELCRVERDVHNEADQSVTSISGSCMNWSNIGDRGDEFPFD